MSGTVKVLLAGPCRGEIDALFKRVSSVNASNGPFDVLICVGQFFASGDDAAPYQGALTPYIAGEKRAPLPTYFIGGWGAGSVAALEALAAIPDCGITYLGRAGARQIHGLTLAFLDGTYSAAAFKTGNGGEPGDGGKSVARHYTETDLAFAKSSLELQGDVDLLLTCEWPEGLDAGLAGAATVVPEPATGVKPWSARAAELAAAARPRYHVAAGPCAFFARPPYENPDLGAGSHVTRFIGLAPVANSGKQKWVHALGLMPAAVMDSSTLQARPAGTTPNPYQLAAAARLKRAAAPGDLGEQSWRWQEQKKARQTMAAPSLGRQDVIKDRRKTVFVKNVPYGATEEALVEFFSRAGKVVDVVRKANAEGRLNSWCHIQFETKEGMERACQLTGSDLMGRQLTIDAATTGPSAGMGKPVENCWFCLSNPGADVDLVVSVGEEVYVAIDKGAITDSHVLLVSVEHFPSTLSLSPSCHAELDKYWSALQSFYSSDDLAIVGFERYMVLRKSGGNHCHVNAVGIPSQAAAGARKVWEDLAADAGFSLRHLAPATGEAGRAALQDVVGDGEYFRVLLPDGSSLVHPIAHGERHPLNFGREAMARLAGAPERADWKACAVPVAEERARAEAFKERFARFDPLMQG